MKLYLLGGDDIVNLIMDGIDGGTKTQRKELHSKFEALNRENVVERYHVACNGSRCAVNDVLCNCTIYDEVLKERKYSILNTRIHSVGYSSYVCQRKYWDMLLGCANEFMECPIEYTVNSVILPGCVEFTKAHHYTVGIVATNVDYFEVSGILTFKNVYNVEQITASCMHDAYYFEVELDDLARVVKKQKLSIWTRGAGKSGADTPMEVLVKYHCGVELNGVEG